MIKRRDLFLVIILILSSFSLLSFPNPQHGQNTSEEYRVARPRTADGARWTAKIPLVAAPFKTISPQFSMRPPTLPFNNSEMRVLTSDSPSLMAIRRGDHLNLADVFQIPQSKANDELHQMAEGNGGVMWKYLRNLSVLEQHLLYSRLEKMEKRGGLEFKDQKALFNYLKTMQDDNGNFDPAGIPKRNNLNLHDILGLSNDELSTLAQGDYKKIGELLNSARDRAESENTQSAKDKYETKLQNLHTQLKEIESKGQFLFEDQKGLLQYLNQQNESKSTP